MAKSSSKPCPPGQKGQPAGKPGKPAETMPEFFERRMKVKKGK